MKNKFQRLLIQSAYTLLCTTSLFANIIKTLIDNTSSEIGTGVSTLLAEQSYIDHYTTDKSSQPLKNLYIKSSTLLINQPDHALILNNHRVFYPTLNTYTVSGNINYQMNQKQSHRQGFLAGFDYTHYNDLKFTQAALGYQIAIYDLDATLNGYIPLGKTQTYPGTNGSELISMYGFAINAIKKIDNQFDFFFQGSYHWEKSTKNNPLGIDIGIDYHLPYLTISSTGQYRNGIDSEEYGGSLQASMPLLKGSETKSKAKQNIQYIPTRNQSIIINAKEIACTGGARSYSYYGTTTCQSSNPFDSADIRTSGQ